MELAQIKSILLLANIEPTDAVTMVRNTYWPDNDHFDDMRAKYPWWQIPVGDGYITIGWRKRVISIDWSTTRRRGIVTEESTDKGVDYVHAWSIGDAVKYLSRWKELPEVEASSLEGDEYRFVGIEAIKEAFELNLFSGKTVPNQDLAIAAVTPYLDEQEKPPVMLFQKYEQGYRLKITLDKITIDLRP